MENLEKDEWFTLKLAWLKRFFWLFLVAIMFLVFGAILENEIIRSLLFTLGALAFIPLIIMLAFIPILHWKDRYRGDKPKLWGFFLVFETSGWSKIFYWFMHMLPDIRGTGLYKENDG